MIRIRRENPQPGRRPAPPSSSDPLLAPTGAGPSRSQTLAAVGALTLAAGVARFATLGLQSFWADELFTARLMRSSFTGMLSGVPKSESTPYLYYVLAWFWTRVFGVDEAGLRSLSALFGTLLVPVAALAAGQIAGRRAAIVAAAIAACNPFLFWYSQEARAYALLALLTAVGFFFFLRIRRGPGRWDILGWAVASFLAVMTHYFGLFITVAEAAFLVGDPSTRRRSAPAVAAVGLSSVALAPLAYQQRHNGASIAQEASLASRVRELPKDFIIGYNSPHLKLFGLLAGLLVAFSLLVYLRTIVRRPRRWGSSLPPLLVPAAAIAVPVLLAAGGLDYVDSKNLIAALVPALACVAAGFSRGRIGPLLAGALCLVSVVVVASVELMPNYHRTDWRGIGRVVSSPLPGEHGRGARIIVLALHPANLLDPYIPSLEPIPPSGARVREIDLAAVDNTPPGGVTPLPPRPAVAPRPPAGFSLVATEETKTFTVFRYRSPSSRLVTPREVLRLALAAPASAYVQR